MLINPERTDLGLPRQPAVLMLTNLTGPFQCQSLSFADVIYLDFREAYQSRVAL